MSKTFKHGHTTFNMKAISQMTEAEFNETFRHLSQEYRAEAWAKLQAVKSESKSNENEKADKPVEKGSVRNGRKKANENTIPEPEV